MAETICGRDDLCSALEMSQELGEPAFDLSHIFGTQKPLYVSIENLLDVVANHDAPEVGLHWDGDKTLTVKKTDGGVMATFEITF